MKGTKPLFVWAFSLLFFTATSQTLERRQAIAESAFYDEDFEEALFLYEDIISSYDKVDNKTLYRAEICSLLTKYPQKPLEGFLSFEETIGASDKFYNYWKGRILLRKYKMREANDAFTSFLKTDKYLSKEIKEEVKGWMNWLQQTKQVMDAPLAYELHHLENNINTTAAELSPVYFSEKKELLFVSNRDDSKKDDYFIYHSLHDQGRKWTDPQPLKNLGSFTRDNSNIEVVAEDGRLFQFRNKKKGDLFYSNPIEGINWSSPQEFDSKITSTHLSSHFFINEHEDRIIFATNMGTKRRKNLDLFESFRNAETGKWSKPQLFAYSINSELNEDSPYLSPDEKSLYFSSDGHESIGGYDVFVSHFDSVNQVWLEPVNLGFPINTPDDEFHFKLNPDQRSGYFTSNRLNTLGDYDIFFFWEIEKIKMEGRVVDVRTNSPVEDAEIFFRPYGYLDMYFYSSIDDRGKFSASINSDDIFKVEIVKDGLPIYQEDFEIHETGGLETTHIKDFYIGGTPSASEPEDVKEEAGESQLSEQSQLTKLANKFRNTNTVVIQNIYFDIGTSQLTDQSVPILNSLKNVLLGKTSMRIEIAGHTDNVGGNQVNQELSMKRAERVLKWLVKNGVSRKRLIAKGYGSSQPLASNDDEKDGRELNRRIEIHVIE